VTERAALEGQTRRNLDGMEHERAGRIDLAVELYERNVAEGFEGDWPYGRLVAHYERVGRLNDAARVLERAIDVFGKTKRRAPADRRAALRAFRGRLRLVQKAQRDRAKLAGEGGR
jgi:hypothetical protein